MRPPSLGARAVARFVDGALVAVIVAAAASPLDLSRGGRAAAGAAVAVAYETTAIARWGRTVGKRLFGIAVTDIGGSPPSWEQAATRAVVLLVPLQLLAPRIDTVGEWLVLLIVMANFIVVARRRDDRRGIHDLAARTRPIAAALA